MTRKHFQLIADALREAPLEGNLSDEQAATARRIVAHGLARELYGTNPRFDRDRFLRACGV